MRILPLLLHTAIEMALHLCKTTFDKAFKGADFWTFPRIRNRESFVDYHHSSLPLLTARWSNKDGTMSALLKMVSCKIRSHPERSKLSSINFVLTAICTTSLNHHGYPTFLLVHWYIHQFCWLCGLKACLYIIIGS